MWTSRGDAASPERRRSTGLAAAACTAGGGAVVAKSLPADWHVNSVPASIVLGAAAANAAPAAVREAIAPGLKFATSTVLRSGIVLVGAKLSAAQVLALGWTTVMISATIHTGCRPGMDFVS